jgi:excisionase family DNA binding protein
MTPRRRHIVELFESARNFAPSDELIDVHEAARRLGLPKSTVYELTRNRAHVHHDHPLPCFKVGRRLKFNWSSVVAWLDTLEKEAGAS